MRMNEWGTLLKVYKIMNSIEDFRLGMFVVAVFQHKNKGTFSENKT